MRKIFVVLSVGLMFLFVGYGQSKAEENIIQGCVNKVTGILRIVNDPSKCRKLESPISWNQSGPPASPGTGSIQVYDANEQYLGILMYPHMIFIPSLKKFISLGTNPHHGTPGDIITDYFYYETKDCSGDAYMPSEDWIQKGVDGKYFVSDQTRTEVTHWSCWSSDEKICIEFSSPQTSSMVKAVEIPKEEIPFTLPVALPLRYDVQ